MDTWQSWVVLAVSTVVTMLVRSSFAERKRIDDMNAMQERRLMILEKELAILQKTALSDKEVRSIIREENKSLHDKIDKVDEHIEVVSKVVQDIQIAFARDLYHNEKNNK